ncbi:hypothetical protein PF003_g31235 [Phytophthora fragariae]|nr:hypothetical protein PF003_g31235 [Phytophthora fragariae]
MAANSKEPSTALLRVQRGGLETLRGAITMCMSLLGLLRNVTGSVCWKIAPRTYDVCGCGVGVGGVHQGRAACVDAVLLVKEVLRAWTLCRRGVGVGSVHQGRAAVHQGRAACVDSVLVLAACAGSVHQGGATYVDAVLVKEVLRGAACVDAVLLVKEVLRAWTLCRRGVGVGSVHQGRAACVDAVLVLEACTKDMDFD